MLLFLRSAIAAEFMEKQVVVGSMSMANIGINIMELKMPNNTGVANIWTLEIESHILQVLTLEF